MSDPSGSSGPLICAIAAHTPGVLGVRLSSSTQWQREADAAQYSSPFHLLRHIGMACQIIGDSNRASDLLRRAVTDTEGKDSVEAAQALAERGEIKRAEGHLKDAALRFATFQDHRQAAAVEGRIADIMLARGQLDEALAVRPEKELPVYQRLGDVRGEAIRRTKLAITLFRRGREADLETAVDHLRWAHSAAEE